MVDKVEEILDKEASCLQLCLGLLRLAIAESSMLIDSIPEYGDVLPDWLLLLFRMSRGEIGFVYIDLVFSGLAAIGGGANWSGPLERSSETLF